MAPRSTPTAPLSLTDISKYQDAVLENVRALITEAELLCDREILPPRLAAADALHGCDIADRIHDTSQDALRDLLRLFHRRLCAIQSAEGTDAERRFQTARNRRHRDRSWWVG